MTSLNAAPRRNSGFSYQGCIIFDELTYASHFNGTWDRRYRNAATQSAVEREVITCCSMSSEEFLPSCLHVNVLLSSLQNDAWKFELTRHLLTPHEKSMHGASYFQAKAGTKRKPVVLLDAPELNKCLIKGIQADALRRVTQKNAARISNLNRNVGDKFHDWRYKLRSRRLPLHEERTRQFHRCEMASQKINDFSMPFPESKNVCDWQARFQSSALWVRKQEEHLRLLWEGGLQGWGCAGCQRLGACFIPAYLALESFKYAEGIQYTGRTVYLSLEWV